MLLVDVFFEVLAVLLLVAKRTLWARARARVVPIIGNIEQCLFTFVRLSHRDPEEKRGSSPYQVRIRSPDLVCGKYLDTVLKSAQNFLWALHYHNAQSLSGKVRNTTEFT